MPALLCVTTMQRPWRLTPPSVAEVADLPNPSQPILVDVGQFFPLKHYLGDRFPQVVHVFGTMTYQQPADPTRGLRALTLNPRAPRFEEPARFFSAHTRFYIVCHKAYGAGKLIPELTQRHAPVVRETPEYLVYDYVQQPNHE
ncbi:MAG: hypothetical protein NZ585_07935 [Chloracidobacterium sp.]|nr:hypothetical protein [Chloracidobacterium sp.]MDW8218060.1 hypothetical protein [Acidobacteriota bacterium]